MVLLSKYKIIYKYIPLTSGLEISGQNLQSQADLPWQPNHRKPTPQSLVAECSKTTQNVSVQPKTGPSFHSV